MTDDLIRRLRALDCVWCLGEGEVAMPLHRGSSDTQVTTCSKCDGKPKICGKAADTIERLERGVFEQTSEKARALVREATLERELAEAQKVVEAARRWRGGGVQEAQELGNTLVAYDAREGE